MKKRYILFLILLIFIALFCYFYKFENNNKSEKKEVENKIEKEEVKDAKKSMSIVMVGDAVIHNGVYLDASIGNGQYDFKSMFEYMPELIKDYDLKYYNQETIIGGKNLGLSNYPRFNSPDEIGSDLVYTGFNMVSLATNHTLDKGETGVIYSTNFWKSKEDVISAGTYLSNEDRNNIPVYNKNGINFAFLSYTTSTNGIPIPDGKEYLVNVYDKEKVKIDIESIKEKTDVIIVAMHWGSEYTFEPTEEQKEIASYLSNLDVNLIIGTHPHVIEPVDYVGDTLVIYSLGNFISAQHSLGIDKIVGLMVGLNINVENNKVTFDDIKYELLYTYCTSNYKNFKIYPFSKLDDNILKDYNDLRDKYLNIVNTKVSY